MKIGAENKTQVRWMIALVAILVLVAVYNLWDTGSSSAAPPPATTSVTPAQKKAGTQKAGTLEIADNKLDPRLRTDILFGSQRVKYEAGGRNIFRMEDIHIETPLQPPKQLAVMGPFPSPTPTPTPPPPPIDLKFYGFASKPNEPKRVFLQQGPDNFVAKQGDIVKSRYKVVQISNLSVMIEDMLYNNRQTIPLTAR